MEMYEDRSAIFQQDGDIVHYGVKGMRWGVRRAKDSIKAKWSAHRKAKAADRKKMNSIYEQNRDLDDVDAFKTDRDIANYGRKKFVGKVLNEAAPAIAGAMVKTIFTQGDRLANPGSISKADRKLILKALAVDSAIATASRMAAKEIEVKSLSSKYKMNGNKAVRKSKRGFITREDILSSTLGTAATAAPYIYDTLSWSAKVARNRARNEKYRQQVYKSNLLNEPYNNIINASGGVGVIRSDSPYVNSLKTRKAKVVG